MSGILQVKYVAGIGIILSIYAYYVETQSELDSNYEAMCDINEHISCTKVFSSKWDLHKILFKQKKIVMQIIPDMVKALESLD